MKQINQNQINVARCAFAIIVTGLGFQTAGAVAQEKGAERLMKLNRPPAAAMRQPADSKTVPMSCPRRPLNAQLKGALGLQDDTSACGVCGKNVQGDRGFAKINHGGIMVNLCCPHCLETFKKDPGPHMARLAKVEAYRVFKGMKE